jgi:FAD/FMN-containing dehydrogenase
MSATGVRIATPPRFRGELVQPGDPGYDEARKIYNELVQGSPAVVARCIGAQDVVDALALAREHDLEVSVRGGGHSIGGWSSNDGGLVVDLTLMRQVWIDSDARTAWVGGGTRAGDLLVEADRVGLVAATGAATSIGLAGLTMGLGEAYLTPRLGYGADHLLAFELVTAAGEVLRVTPDEHPDLFWALRGAGPNFGVVTAMKLQLHPAPERAVGGSIAFDGADPGALTREIWRLMEHGSEWFWPMFVYGVDESGRPQVTMIPGHTGTAELAERELDRVCQIAPPVDDARRVGSYLDLVFELPLRPGRRQWDLLRFPFGGDPERQMRALLDRFRAEGDDRLTPGRELLLWRSVAPPPPRAPGVAPRLEGITIMPSSLWLDPAEDAAELGWIERTVQALRAAGVVEEAGNAMNHVGVAEEERVRRVYGPESHRRLAELKARYDSDNLFHRNFNIRPDVGRRPGG